MGKRGRGGKSGYTHVPTHNPKAHDSGERRMQMLRNLEVKRHLTRVEKQKEVLRNYLPPDVVAKKKQKVDPHFDLRGPARVARDFYLPKEEEVEPVDLLELYDGKMWEHEEGQRLLVALLEYGAALHNVGNRSRDAVATFQNIQKMDPGDHLLARHRQLECYLDNAEADRARELLDAFPQDRSALFAYSRALIEYLSLQLKEDGASAKLCDKQLMEAYNCNPYAAFALANHSTFSQVVEHTSVITDALAVPGSVEDALRYFITNVPLWQEIEGSLDWVAAKVRNLPPPLVEMSPHTPRVAGGSAEGLDDENVGQDDEEDDDDDEDEDDEAEEQEEDQDQDQDQDGKKLNGKELNEGEGEDDKALALSRLSEDEIRAIFADQFNTAMEISSEEK